MKKVLLLNGSPHEKGCTYTALTVLSDTLKENGIASDIFHAGKGVVPGCAVCGSCGKTGRCALNDGVNEILDRLDDYGAVVIGSPVYYSAPSGQICSFCDRLFVASKGRMANKLGAAVVSCRRGGASASFDRLNKYFGISNMHTVGSQYWNQVHGSKPEDVLQDAEGVQTLRTLAENMAWLMKCIEAGAEAGIPLPSHEPAVKTNFIR